MRVVMCQNISGGTEKGAEKVGRGSGFECDGLGGIAKHGVTIF